MRNLIVLVGCVAFMAASPTLVQAVLLPEIQPADGQDGELASGINHHQALGNTSEMRSASFSLTSFSTHRVSKNVHPRSI